MYSGEEIYVRKGGPVCDNERIFFKKRVSVIRKVLSRVFDCKINRLPHIGLMCSGGGYRAMIVSLACMSALSEIDVMDMLLYVSTLSGSTWCLAGMIHHMNRDLYHCVGNKKNISTAFKWYKDFMMERCNKNLFEIELSYMKVLNYLYSKYADKQSVSIVDIWGAIIGNMIFGSDWNNVYMSQNNTMVESAKIPYPIYTSIMIDGELSREMTGPVINTSTMTEIRNNFKVGCLSSNDGGTHENYSWVEYNTYEVGLSNFGLYIPSNTFNSVFNGGKMVDRKIMMNMSNMLGIFGSAFCVDINDMARLYGSGSFVWSLIKNVLDEIDLGNVRISTGRAYNMGYNMKDIAKWGKLSQQEISNFIDGGIDFNIPIVPLLKRNCDIYIICDATGNHDQIHNLKQTIDYAKSQGHKMPYINYKKINLTTISVFSDPDDSTPTIIYIPNNLDYSTFKLQYTNKEFNHLYNNIYNLIINHKKLILSAIKKHI